MPVTPPSALDDSPPPSTLGLLPPSTLDLPPPSTIDLAWTAYVCEIKAPSDPKSFQCALDMLVIAWKGQFPTLKFPIKKVCFLPMNKSPLARPQVHQHHQDAEHQHPPPPSRSQTQSKQIVWRPPPVPVTFDCALFTSSVMFRSITDLLSTTTWHASKETGQL
jgi:hypothetical protein